MSWGLEGPVSTHVPVLRIGDVLLVTLQGELHDKAAEQLQQDIGEAVAGSSAGAVVIDVSGVEIVDSFLGRVFAEIAANAKLLAAETVVAGMRPAVAITLVELGLTLPGLRTALDVQEALRMLAQPSTPLSPGQGRQENA
ncbi:STAS domain-containing protein [Streptomyces sp. NPDC093228]|uniref:STAS domain-containing protein n=1 Tax=unclassified Streptomyces TaxID=2593676 RepID=UPI000740E651|nr:MULTISPECIES: STAS domain-containing protein [unclassified Streptomyces]KUJ58100.1 anti-anti-sigma factor [Streptomyces sp. NRRL F-5122]MDX3258286.1 STAS domain-containing protein [Streptomyces sp. MI02-2A]